MLDEARELDLIRSVLVEALPDESRRVGKTNLNDIVRRRGQVWIAPMTGASRLDWTVSLAVLASATTLLSQCLIITKTLIDARTGGKADSILRIEQTNQLSQVEQVSQGSDGGQIIVVNQIKLLLPPEILDRLEPAVVDRLIDSFVAHLDAVHEQGSDSREPT